jgi:hypothetical protein
MQCVLGTKPETGKKDILYKWWGKSRLDPSRPCATSPEICLKIFPRANLEKPEHDSVHIYKYIILLLLEVLFLPEHC